MNAIVTRIAATVAITVGAGAVALGAAIASTPIASAATFQQMCVNDPAAYAYGAVRGVYSTEKHGFDRYEVCKVYDAAGKLLGTTNVPNYGYYKVGGPQQPPVAERI